MNYVERLKRRDHKLNALLINGRNVPYTLGIGRAASYQFQGRTQIGIKKTNKFRDVWNQTV